MTLGRPPLTHADFMGRIGEPTPSGCWPWAGSMQSNGYGRFGRTQAHRVAYSRLVGPIPEGLTIDHLCENKWCVNPAHLEPVPQLLNTRRATAGNYAKTHCKRGHPFDEANTRHNNQGRRVCRACARLRWAGRQGSPRGPILLRHIGTAKERHRASARESARRKAAARRGAHLVPSVRA